jgi:hypothetical protein
MCLYNAALVSSDFLIRASLPGTSSTLSFRWQTIGLQRRRESHGRDGRASQKTNSWTIPGVLTYSSCASLPLVDKILSALIDTVRIMGPVGVGKSTVLKYVDSCVSYSQAFSIVHQDRRG